MGFNGSESSQNADVILCGFVKEKWRSVKESEPPVHSNRSGLSWSGFTAGWSSGKVSDKDTHSDSFFTLAQETQAECFVVGSRIRGAGGSCLCSWCLRLFSTSSPSRRSLDGWRTRTPRRTTPACGSSAEAATPSGTASPSWSSVSTDQSPSRHKQCWGKILLKVMHYNIALLSKELSNYIT